jgi:Ser/Thr protein kinase RdoA (MazF antagonist)
MLAGIPHEARWTSHEPRRIFDPPQLECVIHAAFGSRQVSGISPLIDGFRNANFKIELADPFDRVVLRLYEHDPVLCRKEIDLFRLVAGAVPVPEIIHAEPDGLDGIPPFILTRFVEGMSLRDLRHIADNDALAEAGYSVGQTLAAIGRFSFVKPGWISAGSQVTMPLLEGSDPVPRFIELCLSSANLQDRVPPEVCDRIRTLMWNWAPRLAELDSQSQLVHGDFGHRNILVQAINGKWRVAAVLDWEFAISATALADIGHFLLRHERRSMNVIEPTFVRGYLDHGGKLPEGWRSLAGLIDLTALCESLTHEQLPDTIAMELADLVQRTAEAIRSLG